MNYRKRCYNSYGLHWKHSHTLNQEEFDFYAKVAKKRFQKFLPSDKSAKILDVACGAGHFLYFLKKEGYTNIHGIDLSKDQIAVAKKMDINVEEADLFDYLPKHPEEYGMIVANDIIEHLTKDEVMQFLDLIHSALKPGGKVLISTVNSSSLFGTSIRYIDFTHETGFTPLSLTQVLEVCGFEDVEIYGEEPVIHDLRSLIRALLWKVVSGVLKGYLIIESGTGRGLWKRKVILEPRMFALGRKPLK